MSAPAPAPPEYQPRVVVKLRDDDAARTMVAGLARGDGDPGGSADGPVPEPLVPLTRQFGGTTVTRLMQSASRARLEALSREAARSTDGVVPNLANFYSVALPPGLGTATVAAAARELRGIEHAYPQGPPTQPPVVLATDDPRSANQGYLDPAPAGIDARHVWWIPGGDGDGIGFVDVERGWTLGHEDLIGGSISLLSGLNKDYFGHGTAVLGEVMAQDNSRGCVGITPMVDGSVVSQWRTASNYSTADAIVAAIIGTRPGDVILLEAQTTVGGSTFLPVEVELDVWAAVFVGTILGRVIVEAAANGSNDLDAYSDPTYGFILRRGHADFRESGAIMVGAASSAAPHARSHFSNYGSRIDCYAWGQNIDTTGDGGTGNSTTTYTTSFGGTSGASPIVTGAAIALQGMTKAMSGSPLSPERVREILSDPANGTASANPTTDRIGVMPDLRKIVRSEGLGPPVGDFPTPRDDIHYAGPRYAGPRYAGPRYAAFIDPGHGGAVDRPLSTAYGSPSTRNGQSVQDTAVEKDINLEVARRVCDQLGDAAVLSRSGDYNLSLRERIERARDANAAAFVSIHSNTGRTDHGRPEVWVYGDSVTRTGRPSTQLAERIRSELASVQHEPVSVRQGNLALLRPELHGEGVAACLVETGSLRHPGGRARLSDHRNLETIGQAVARGVSRYLEADLAKGGR